MDIDGSLGHANEAAHRLHEFAMTGLEQAPEAAFGQERRLFIVERGPANCLGDAAFIRFPNESQDTGERGGPIRIARQACNEAQRLRLLHDLKRRGGPPHAREGRTMAAGLLRSHRI